MSDSEQILKIVKVNKSTGYNVMECRKALVRTDWDVQNAISYLCKVEYNCIEIGMTREIYNNEKYPSMRDLIYKPIKEKDKIVKYMKESKIQAVAPAIVTDVINPEIRFGELFFMTDSKYCWRSDVIYYFDKYDMELPEEFIQHALKHLW